VQTIEYGLVSFQEEWRSRLEGSQVDLKRVAMTEEEQAESLDLEALSVVGE
jgi:hypothetical protein